MSTEVRIIADNLISVESQREYSVTDGKSQTRIFVKMYVDAVRTGLIADMGVKNWTTLCVIASFMDAEGQCYPTQAQIAKGLGVSRQTANAYVKGLIEYRWEGKPVVVSMKGRAGKGRFDNTRYTVSRISNLEIFDGKGMTVSKPTDTVTTDTANVDTKKN